MNTGFIWSVILSIVGLTGLYVAGRKSHWGWFIGLGAQFLWAIFAITTAQYGFLLSVVGYGWVYWTNWRKWRAEVRKKEHSA